MAPNHTPRFLAIVNEARKKVRECTVEDVRSRLDKGETLLIVDVREESEFARDHIPGAIHLGKGIIERDLETGRQTFHPLVPVQREFLDLPPIEGRGLAAAELDAAIAAAAQRIPGGVDGKVIRLVARDVPSAPGTP